MAELGPHQENPYQADPQLTEPIGSQRQNNPSNPGTNLGNGRNYEVSVHTTQTSQSRTQIGSRVSWRRNDHQAMQREIEDLKRKLRHARRKQSPSSSDASSNEEEDVSYRRRSRTPPSETFSYEKEVRPAWRYESPSSKGLGNDAMNKALDHISRSPFTHRIEGLNYPDVLINQRFPFTTAEQTRWSTWASLTNEWPSTPKMRLWCAKFSRPAWGQWRWDGSIA